MRESDLVEEILQIIQQYKKEVPTARRTWPASVRERVVALRRLELSNREISNRTGIPESTVYIMCRGKPYARKKSAEERFLPVEVKPKSEANMAPPETPKHFNIVLPGGIRVEGVSADTLVMLSRRLSS